MPYEASPEDIAASAAAADAALSHQGIAAEPTTPAQTSSQASAESSPQDSSQILSAISAQALLPQDAVVIHEVDLLARFERMEAMPLLPLEIGTAVIFNPRSTPDPRPRKRPSPAPEAAAAEAVSVEAAASEAVAAEAVVSEAAAPEAMSPEPAVTEPLAELAAGIPRPRNCRSRLPRRLHTSESAAAEAASVEAAVSEVAAAEAPHADLPPALELEPPAPPAPEATAGEDWTVEFKLPSMLLPSVDFGSAPPPVEAAAEPEAKAAPVAGPAMPAAELSAIEAVIAEAFPELKAAAEMAPPTTAEPSPAPAAEAAPEPGQDIAEPPVQDAAAEVARSRSRARHSARARNRTRAGGRGGVGAGQSRRRIRYRGVPVRRRRERKRPPGLRPRLPKHRNWRPPRLFQPPHSLRPRRGPIR